MFVFSVYFDTLLNGMPVMVEFLMSPLLKLSQLDNAVLLKCTLDFYLLLSEFRIYGVIYVCLFCFYLQSLLLVKCVLIMFT